MKKILVLGLFLFGVIGIWGDSYAEELSNEQIVEEITKENPENAVLKDEKEELYITAKTQTRIDDFLQDNMGNSSYIDEILGLVDKNSGITNQEYNEYIISSIESKSEANEIKTTEQVVHPNLNEQAIPRNQRVVDPFIIQKKAYRAGQTLVASRGGTMTANYMAHAEVTSPGAAAPSLYLSKNNSWAQTIATPILNANYSDFKKNGSYLSTYVQRGSYAFTSGDPYWALHNVSYVINYVRQANGGYKFTVTVNDVYDFAWSKYENVQVGFGNNYCFAMQTIGLIKPFNIQIIYQM
ncbi:hypothetical protein LI951_12085 [Enterococcus sp. BWT-B8]|uniref:hypothetical protein n=1 Tax=Enterococcus sp. BWT-B8 TaxID=2885157 RepID=UPI001E590921|nr:hypothetical protein [Enterococcus sp. BWT-B8]MCB5952808.1 hypothetical protein [Enterococcus sp. BWT-B8]